MDSQSLELIASGLAAPHLLANRMNPERFLLYRHIEYIGTRIAMAVAKGNARLLINMGPRWGKSELISVATPTWAIARDPSAKVIMASATQPLARMWGSRNKDNFTNHPWLNVQVKEDTDAKADWVTTAGGGMRSVGIGTAVLGFGANLMIVDDPYGEWKDAQSIVYRKNVEDWYMATAESRLEPGASVIVLHHRMHPQDLSAFLTKGKDGARWEHICLPSIATGPDVLGRKPGESLDPERWGVEELEMKRLAMRGMWEPMHQQNPMAAGTGAAYSHFGTHNIDATVAFNPALPLHISVDFNINPGMHVLLGQHDKLSDIAWVFDEIHAQSMSVEGAAKELIRRIKLWPVKPKEIQVYGDRGGQARSITTAVSHYNGLFRALEPLGIPVRDRSTAEALRVVERIANFNYALKDVSGKVWYKVHPSCEILIRDLHDVQLTEKGDVDKTSDMHLTHATEAEGHRMHWLRGMRQAIKQPKGKFVTIG